MTKARHSGGPFAWGRLENDWGPRKREVGLRLVRMRVAGLRSAAAQAACGGDPKQIIRHRNAPKGGREKGKSGGKAHLFNQSLINFPWPREASALSILASRPLESLILKGFPRSSVSPAVHPGTGTSNFFCKKTKSH